MFPLKCCGLFYTRSMCPGDPVTKVSCAAYFPFDPLDPGSSYLPNPKKLVFVNPVQREVLSPQGCQLGPASHARSLLPSGRPPCGTPPVSGSETSLSPGSFRDSEYSNSVQTPPPHHLLWSPGTVHTFVNNLFETLL